MLTTQLPEAVQRFLLRDAENRDSRIKKDEEKRDKFYNPRGVHDDKPNLVDINNLPDMDIG